LNPFDTLLEGYQEKHAAVLFGRVKLYGHRAHNDAVGDEVFPQLFGNGSLTIADADRSLRVFDMFGNEVSRSSDTISLPLDEHPYYVTSDAGLAWCRLTSSATNRPLITADANVVVKQGGPTPTASTTAWR
jgi:hypothetical protein